MGSHACLYHQRHGAVDDSQIYPEPYALEPYLSDWGKAAQTQSSEQSERWEAEKTPFIKRLPAITRESWSIARGVLLYILIGIGIGATMHGYVPEGFFKQYLSAENWWGVPLAVVLAVPMYANAAGIVPIVEVFVDKGIPLGTAIAFMMVMTWRLIGIFFGVVTLLIIISGYLFNWML